MMVLEFELNWASIGTPRKKIILVFWFVYRVRGRSGHVCCGVFVLGRKIKFWFQIK